MDNWKSMESVPKGRFSVSGRGTSKTFVHIPVPIIAQSNIGEVIPSYFIPDGIKMTTGRFIGFTKESPPVLWQPYPKPRMENHATTD